MTISGFQFWPSQTPFKANLHQGSNPISAQTKTSEFRNEKVNEIARPLWQKQNWNLKVVQAQDQAHRLLRARDLTHPMSPHLQVVPGKT